MKKIVMHMQVAAATAIAFGPAVAMAQALRTGTLPVTGTALTTGKIIQLMNDVAQFLITAAVIIAVIMIVYGGIVWMYKGSEKGKEILTKGIIGVAIVLGVGVILSTVARVVTTQSL